MTTTTFGQDLRTAKPRDRRYKPNPSWHLAQQMKLHPNYTIEKLTKEERKAQQETLATHPVPRYCLRRGDTGRAHFFYTKIAAAQWLKAHGADIH